LMLYVGFDDQNRGHTSTDVLSYYTGSGGRSRGVRRACCCKKRPAGYPVPVFNIMK
jgi:hypothetical protein